MRRVSLGVVMAIAGALCLITATVIDDGVTAGLIATGVAFLVGAIIYTISHIES
jgi:hypothetical protein